MITETETEMLQLQSKDCQTLMVTIGGWEKKRKDSCQSQREPGPADT